MLPNKKNDLLHLLNILESIEKIRVYTSSAESPESFYGINEQLNFNATLNLLANIGESCTKVSKELKNENKDVDWKVIKDFRNQVTHNYMGIDIYMVYDVVKNDLEMLGEAIVKIIKKNVQEAIFDKEEMTLAKGSYYYRHIKFEELE